MWKFLWYSMGAIATLMWIGFLFIGLLGHLGIFDMSFEEITRWYAVSACNGIGSLIVFPPKGE